jgi:hypothetical protein
MKVEKCSNIVYLTWNNPIEARILIKILTSTFPRNYIDYLLICLIRDKFEIALRNPSRIVGHVYKIMLDPIYIVIQLMGILDNCVVNDSDERIFLQDLYGKFLRVI